MTATNTLMDDNGAAITWAISNELMFQVLDLLEKHGQAERVPALTLPDAVVTSLVDTPDNGPDSPMPSPDGYGKQSVAVSLDLPHTVRAGHRTGYVELLYRSAPDETTRDTLKAAGFRWSSRFKLWYGLESDLPEAYRVLTVEPREVETPAPVSQPVPAPANDDAAFMASLASLMNA